MSSRPVYWTCAQVAPSAEYLQGHGRVAVDVTALRHLWQHLPVLGLVILACVTVCAVVVAVCQLLIKTIILLCTVQTLHDNLCHPSLYVSELVHTVAGHSLCTGLSSDDTTNYALRHLGTKSGKCSPSYAGPAAWNSLPHDLRDMDSFCNLKKLLKTHPVKPSF